MPLALAGNRFGFMWTEIGSTDWDVYVRLKNLLSSALLRAMLVQQREQAQKEVERLLNEARERAWNLPARAMWRKKPRRKTQKCSNPNRPGVVERRRWRVLRVNYPL
ncbi:MAG: hypothetical protein M0C28_36175 [Candidatus Moduliflexus flocculans]|nr:hypothetical protein [Candidatus Moduliflexus flocculans]